MRDKVQSFFSQYSFATPVIAGYCDAGTMYANIPAPFHPVSCHSFACLSSLNGFSEIQSIFHIIDI
jgi:hypothetical protein